MSDSPFHKGELEFQQLVGEADAARRNGTIIKEEILAGAISFISRQRLVVLGTMDSDNNIYASIVAGHVGFMRTTDQKHLLINLTQSFLPPQDRTLENLKTSPYIGCLLIELDSRRRLKINGSARIKNNDLLEVTVAESYPLCPKYIQRRQIALENTESTLSNASGGVESGISLGSTEVLLIERADTFFIATAYPAERLDVAHRGGVPGFVQVVNDRLLRIPDFSGNSMFNSFGNLRENPNAGLVFPDFKNGTSLQLVGTARILLDQNDPDGKSGGTNRFWEFEISRWQRQALYLTETEFLDYSPFNPNSS